MGKYKILHINGRADLSGGPITMLKLIQYVDHGQFEHVVLCPPELNGIARELKECANCSIILMKFRPFNFLSLLKLFMLTRRDRFDLIHSHGKAAGIYSRIAGRFMGISVAHQLHGIHYKNHIRFLQLFYLKVESFLSHWSQRIICVSESEKLEGLSLEIFKRNQAVVVRNAVDVERFRPSKELKYQLRQRMGIPRDAKVLISITRYCYQKNPELTLHIHARICRKIPNAYLVLFGIPPDSRKIIKLAESLNISNQVVLIDKQSEMNKLLNIGDVYISTSRWEGLSLGVIEAMAMEMPVVLSQVVGNEELMAKYNGEVMFVKNESVPDYVKAIERLLRDDGVSQELGKLARKRICSDFNLSDSIKKMELEYLANI